MTLNRFFASPALILVLATGIYQVSAGGIGALFATALGRRVMRRRSA